MHETTPTQLLQMHLQRLQACRTTIDSIHLQVFDPIEPDRRADLLIAVEDVANAAVALALEVRDLVWNSPDLTPHDDHAENRKVD